MQIPKPLAAMRNEGRSGETDVFELEHVAGSESKLFDNGFALSFHTAPRGFTHSVRAARPGPTGADRVIRYIKCPHCKRTICIQVKSMAARDRTRWQGFFAGVIALMAIVAEFWLVVALVEPTIGEPSTSRQVLGLTLAWICSMLQLVVFGGFMITAKHRGARVIDERDARGEWIGANHGRKVYHHFVN